MADDIIYSDDYTRLIAYQSRSWTMGDISLAVVGGIQWAAARAALVIGAGSSLLLVGVLLLVSRSPWWAVLPTGPAMLWAYVKVAKDRSGGLTELERLRLRLHHRYRQPAWFNGLTADTEPSQFRWDVILWCPDSAVVPVHHEGRQR